MNSLRCTRITMGAVLLIGLLFWKPLAYFVAIMLIVAGVIGKCFLERIFNKICTGKVKCCSKE